MWRHFRHRFAELPLLVARQRQPQRQRKEARIKIRILMRAPHQRIHVVDDREGARRIEVDPAKRVGERVRLYEWCHHGTEPLDPSQESKIPLTQDLTPLAIKLCLHGARANVGRTLRQVALFQQREHRILILRFQKEVPILYFQLHLYRFFVLL